MMLTHHGGDGGKKARSPGRPQSKPLKPLRGEGRGFPVNLWWYLLVWFSFFPREAAGAPKHPAFPAPSDFSRALVFKTRAGYVARVWIRAPDAAQREKRCAADPGPISRPIRSRLCQAALHAASRPGQEASRDSAAVHCSNICVHHPANRQWPFGRHLCKGSQEP
jgi:hypothetical protein